MHNMPITNHHKERALVLLANRFPARKKFSESLIRRFAKAITRYEETGEGTPPERWMLKEFGG